MLLKYLGCALICFLLCNCSSRKENRILIYTSFSTDQHTSQAALVSLLAQARQDQIPADTTSSTAFLTDDDMQQYGAVVFVNTPTDVLTTKQQNVIERFVQAGGGFVGIHAAPSSTFQWPWYNKMLGAHFSRQPGTDTAVHNGLVRVVNANHPSTDGLSQSWNQSNSYFKAISYSPDIMVVVETNDKVPVSWYREYDGGRLFYTAAGGTADLYSNSNFMKHIFGGIRYALDGPKLDYKKALTKVVPEESRFLSLVLDSYLDEPIEMEIMNDNRVIFIERLGKVKIYNPVTKATTLAATLDVHTSGNYEDGLLGLELDPDFDRNHYIYLYYSPVGSEAVQHLSRFTLQDDKLLLHTEKVVLKVPVQRESCCHSAGNILFGPDGNLYLTTGDNTSSKESDGFSPIDERPGRGPYDAQKSSANTHDLRGKILRIKVHADGSYTIPEGNLFPKDGSQGRPEIYIMGARNPYRMTVDKRGFVYWGDVGPDGGVASERGPLSLDEWNQAKKPGNYGWPYFVGENEPYAKFDFATNTVGALFDPDKPVNNSPNNFGAQLLPPAQKALIWYPYKASDEFPMLGSGSRSAMAGPFYTYNRSLKSRYKFPVYYDDKFFIFDWARDWVMVVSFDEEGAMQQIEPFLPNQAFHHPIDMKFGPDGAMYVLNYGANYFSRNPDAQLVRIEYADGNRQPVARISVQGTVGAAPFKVSLSAKESYDYDQDDVLSYTWNSGSGESSTDVDTEFTYAQPGIYRVKLTVTDKAGEQAIAETAIKVGNAVPEVSIVVDGNQSFYYDNKLLKYTVQVNDKEDGSLGSGIAPGQVRFAIDYLKEGKDLALLSSAHQTGAHVSLSHIKGKALIESSDCHSCHAIDQKSIGPSWMDVATRYQGKTSEVNRLAKFIITGGNGQWGRNMMAAHPQHTLAETTEMVNYILSLNQASASMLPLDGTYLLKEHTGNYEGGTYVLTASYTDKGNAFTGPLTGQALVSLRHPKVQAEDFDGFRNVGLIRPREGTGATYVSNVKDESYISFTGIDLAEIEQLVFMVDAREHGGIIELRSGGADGKLLSSVQVEPTKAGINPKEPVWRQVSTPVSVGAKVDLFIVFRNSKVKDKNLLNLDWIYFDRGKAVLGKN